MEYKKQVPLHSEWDVIVCGAGPSGIAAAISAARQNMRVMLLERYGIVGGAITAGVVTTLMGSVAKGTIRDEIAAMLVSPDQSTGVDPENAKNKLIALLAKENVTLRLQSPVIDAYIEDRKTAGVFVLTPNGVVLMKGKRIVDATGDGYVACSAGAEVMVGRDGDGLVQPCSLMYHIEGMDEDSTLVCNHEEHYTVFEDGREYLATCEKAAVEGRLPSNITIVRLYATGRKGERLVNATQMNGVNSLHDGDIERSEIELRKQIEQVNEFLRKEIPGCENIRTRISASTLGVRESRRIKGRYLLEAEDLVAGRRFEDAVVHMANFVIDIHNPTGGGQSETDGCPHKAQPYDIPMRALQPLHVDNLVLAGRCISGSHRAHASYRVINIAMAIGQAAGTMAAVSIQKDCDISALNYHDVEAALLDQGCVLR